MVPFFVSFSWNRNNMSNQYRCIMSHFEQLKVWQKAVDLAVRVYEITNKKPFSSDFGLRDQMRRSSVSISSNISEGDELDSDKSSVRHFKIAKGSSGELFTQAIIAFRVSYLGKTEYDYLRTECQDIMAMLSKLIKYRNRP